MLSYFCCLLELGYFHHHQYHHGLLVENLSLQLHEHSVSMELVKSKEEESCHHVMSSEYALMHMRQVFRHFYAIQDPAICPFQYHIGTVHQMFLSFLFPY